MSLLRQSIVQIIASVVVIMLLWTLCCLHSSKVWAAVFGPRTSRDVVTSVHMICKASSVQQFIEFCLLLCRVFITAHDAMHGAIAPSNPKLNQFMGRLAGTLYAGLDYDSMKVAHHEHHLHTGIQEKDPDFHSGNPGVLPWAGKFIKKYLTIKQFVILNLMVGAVQICGAPYKNMVVFLLCAGLLSAAQLFYFGTYVPHRPPKHNPQQVMTWEKSNPTWATTRLASFVTCYHFDCHVEHHHNPRLAWYELWGARKQALQSQ